MKLKTTKLKANAGAADKFKIIDVNFSVDCSGRGKPKLNGLNLINRDTEVVQRYADSAHVGYGAIWYEAAERLISKATSWFL